MAKVTMLNMAGEAVGDIELNDSVFGIEVNEFAVHEVIKNYLANQRQGTQSAKTRGEVRGGGRKPFRQKGTGNARQGSIRAPQFIKGGVVFAPKSRDFSKKMNVTARRTAMFSALSKKVADGEFFVVENIAVENGKTKEMVAFLKAFAFDKTVLVVMNNADEKVIRAASNIEKLQTLPVEQLNTYDVVKNAVVVLSKGSVEKLQEVYGA